MPRLKLQLFTPAEWSFTEKALTVVTTNPFDPAWSERAQTLLGLPARDEPKAFAWHPGVDLWGPRSVYSKELDEPILETGERLRKRLQDGASADEAELGRYELISLYCLYCEHGRALDEMIDAAVRGRKQGAGDDKDRRGGKPPRGLWEKFLNDHTKRFGFKRLPFSPHVRPEHVFACFFTFRRAFYHIFFNIVGFSEPIAKLRSRAWESIFTHDFLAWMRGLHPRMKDMPTLITGPSGTGKERAAEAIGRSLYIPFKNGAFATDFVKAFNPVNLSALASLLIESELFGHVAGAFTGAVKDRVGRLEACPEEGAVFLDEIGEATQEMQVKLLRVLQEHRFQRVGENEDREFLGKIIAATNRDLAVEVRAGRFREDLYYRLCADKIVAPSLREQLTDRPEDLPFLVEFVCRAVLGRDRAAAFAAEVTGWIERSLPGYAWPGNFRELEQCVRSYTIRKEYCPLPAAPPRAEGESPRPEPARGDDPVMRLADLVIEAEGKLTFDELKRRLFTEVSRRAGSFLRAARLLDVDSRTVGAAVKGKKG